MSATSTPTIRQRPQRIVTLLMTDLVDSTALAHTLGDRVWATIVARHDQLARELLERFHGVEINRTDGFTFLFERPIDAVRFALAYHDGLDLVEFEPPAQDADAGAPRRVAARVGIHLGEVVLRENDPQAVARGARAIEVEGLAVAITARVMSCGGARQTLMTHESFNLSRRAAVGEADFPGHIVWLDHGPFALKGVDEPVAICEVGRQGFAPLRAPQTRGDGKVRRLLEPGDEETLGWRPAVGVEIPGREAWRLERRLGAGGFGEVWLARHRHTREQRSYKFCFSADRLRSLKRELTLLRLLKDALGERSDIARLWDVRLDAAPYFLEMEYAPGGDLVTWSDAQVGAGGVRGLRAVPLDTRIDLVAQVAGALAAAHSVGVIHRDVKPSNVLIHEVLEAEGDDAHAPRRSAHARLTDFGIGRLQSPERLAAAGVTATGFTRPGHTLDAAAHTGTPLYTAPELAAGAPPSIQSDIYALGVMLFQALVGSYSRPIGLGWERDLERAWREQGFPDDGRLDLLRDDVADCVAGHPEERLASAAQLARRLRSLPRRLAERRAVAERTSAELRRAASQARHRRQLWLALVSSGVFLLVAGVAGVGYWREARARDAERAQRNLAEASRAAEAKANEKARNAFKLLVTTLATADAGSGGKQDLTVLEAIEDLIPRLEELPEFAADQELAALFRTCAAAILFTNGKYDQALPQAREVVALARKLYPGDHVNTATSLNHVALCLGKLERYEEAQSHFKEAIDMIRRLDDAPQADLAANLSSYAHCLEKTGRMKEALTIHLELERLCETLYPDGHPKLGEITSNLACCYEALEDFEQALKYHERALGIYQGLPIQENVLIGRGHGYLARCLLTIGKVEDATAHAQAAVDLRKQVYPMGHPDLCKSLRLHAKCLLALGRFTQAEASLTQAEKTPGDDPDPRVALEARIELYDAWHDAEPGEGYDARAEEYRRRLGALQAAAEPTRS